MHRLELCYMQKHTYSITHKAHNCKAIRDEWITHSWPCSQKCTNIHYIWIKIRIALMTSPLKFMLHQNWFFSSSFNPIMPSLASSLVGLVYCYMRKDKVGGTCGTALYFSRRNSLQLQLQLSPSCLLHVLCVCRVSEECSRCFMGSCEVKSQRRYQVFLLKMCQKCGL